MTVERSCAGCGYTHTYASDAVAAARHPRHCCQANRERLARQRRVAARAAQRPVRDCHHPGVSHRHGTRAAYVLDRCRCRPCTDANSAAARARTRAIAFGRWSAFLDADQARDHVHQLAAVGIGLRRIAKLAGVGYGTVSRLLHGDPRTGAPPTRRIRPQTEQRLLAVTASIDTLPGRALVDATGTRRRLQALGALGWTTTGLAEALRRSPGNLRRSMCGRAVTADTADAVRELYERLWDTRPSACSTAERTAATNARRRAAEQGWRPPLGWDDIDNDPEPGSADTGDVNTAATDTADPVSANTEPRAQRDIDDVDDIAVERAMLGNPVRLSAAERDEAVRRLTAQGLSVRQIAERLRVTARTVTRRRSAGRAA